MKKRLGTVADALRLSRDETYRLHRKYGNPALAAVFELIGIDQIFVRSEGSCIFDSNGKRYLDFTGAFGANPFGHDLEPILAELEQIRHVPNLLQAALSQLGAQLKENLAIITPGEKLTRSFICSTGAEAVEGALKLARIATGRSKIVYAEKGFHGKTMGALSVTGKEAYQKPFQPLIPGTICVPYDNVEAIKHALWLHDVAAVILEPIQGEGGVRVPSSGYLSEVKHICDLYDTLLIVDEIQTGFGRTGRMFACEYDDVEPDILCLAKALGGGADAVAAYVTTEQVMQKYWTLGTFALHTSTMSERARACAIAIAAMNAIEDRNLCEAAEEKGDYLLERLDRLQAKHSHIISDVRGRGLLVGIELHDPIAANVDLVMHDTGSQLLGSLVAGKLFREEGVLTVYTLNQPRVLRVEPALTVTTEEIDIFVDGLDRVLSQYKGFMSLVMDSLRQPGKLALATKLMTGTVDRE